MALKFSLASLAAIFSLALASSAAAVPGLISYQGQLTDPSGVPITTPVVVTFTFHDVPTGGSPLAAFVDSDVVTPDANGIYSTFIGDEGDPIPSSVFDGDEVWLNVNVDGEGLTPRLRVTSSGFAIRAAAADDAGTLQGLAPSAFFNMDGEAYVVVQTTSNAGQNAANLLAAYDAARLLTPNGQPLAADNRAVVLVAPGNYDLGSGSFTLDADFVDVVGLSTARDNQYIFSSENVLVQTARDVRIENMTFHYTGAVFGTNAYYPNATWNSGANTGSAPETVIRNSRFRASNQTMRGTTEYAGTYEDVVGDDYSFGLSNAIVSGTFVNCSAGVSSFGSFSSTVSGTFTNCSATFGSFGGSNSTVSGTFMNCRAGNASFGSDSSTVSGTFTNCAAGNGSFGRVNATVSGTFTNCSAGIDSFGSHLSTVSGTFTNCSAGDFSFGSQLSTVSGSFTNCSAGDFSFGGGAGGSAPGARFNHCVGGIGSFTKDGSPAPRHLFCVVDDAQYSGNN